MNAPSVAANPLVAVSHHLAGIVESVGASVVALHAGRNDSVAGVFWRSGVVVTVAHAIRHGRELRLILPDGRTAQAALAGIDSTTDLAALRVDDASLNPTLIGDAANVRTGHIAIAVARGTHGELAVDHGLIGRAGGAWQTWRGGRIDRYLRLDGGLAAGFSGAPIADAEGKVIGIGTSALARGYGIVVPDSTVNRVLDELLSKGRVSRGWFGIGTQAVQLPAGLVDSLKLDTPHGLLITSIADDSPAERGGMLLGDIVIAIGAARVDSIDALHAALAAGRIGAAVKVVVVRGGTRAELDVTVGERPRSSC